VDYLVVAGGAAGASGPNSCGGGGGGGFLSGTAYAVTSGNTSLTLDLSISGIQANTIDIYYTL
jgi:hypothetical protein